MRTLFRISLAAAVAAIMFAAAVAWLTPQALARNGRPCDPAAQFCAPKHRTALAEVDQGHVLAAGFVPVLLGDAAIAPAADASEAPDVVGWLVEKLGPSLGKWVAVVGVIALFASWLLTALHGLEAILVTAGWWNGQRRGVYLLLHSALQFLAQNLSRFRPSQVATSAAAK